MTERPTNMKSLGRNQGGSRLRFIAFALLIAFVFAVLEKAWS